MGDYEDTLFRMRPVEERALYFQPGKAEELVTRLRGCLDYLPIWHIQVIEGGTRVLIHRRIGDVTARPCDWIVWGSHLGIRAIPHRNFQMWYKPIGNCHVLNDISTRAYNVLESDGIMTAELLATFTVKEMMTRRNMGRKTVAELRAALAKYGLAFADENSATK